MTLQDVYFSIQDAIREYQYKYGTEPQCIFMSSQLIKYISDHKVLLYSTNKDGGIIGNFRGINVNIYNCSEPQYYLAEGPGMFKKYWED